MCEITTNNFNDFYHQIEQDIKQSKFIAIDTEFSGLSTSDNATTSLFDNPEERYSKLVALVNKIIPVQIGVTAFIFKPDENEYVGKVYTFYVFPRSFFSISKFFLCHSGSLQFLCTHNFDFNKFVYDGLSFLNQDEELELKNVLDANGAFYVNTNEYEGVLKEHSDKINLWFYKANNGDIYELPDVIKKYCNNFEVIYVLHKSLREKYYQRLWTFEENGSFYMKKVASKEYMELSKSSNLEKDIHDRLLGFTKVFRLLCNSSKPVIGHNLLLDLMLLLNICDKPLPKSYKKFKEHITKSIPFIYDTKTISFNLLQKIPKEKKWQNGSLSDLYKYFKDGNGRHLASFSPAIEPQIFLKDDHFHNAGWDSYFTGYIFIRMAHIFAADTNKNVKRKFMLTELLHAVASFKNQINIIRCSISYIQIDGEDPISRRPPFLVVESLTKEPINIGQVQAILSTCGLVEVKALTNKGHRAIIAVDNHFSEKRILKQFKENSKFHIEKYSALKHSHSTKIMLWSSLIASTAAVLFWCSIKKL